MTIVAEYQECPQCGWEGCLYLIDVDSFDEKIVCFACGLEHKSFRLVDRKNSTHEQTILKLDRDGQPIWRITRKPGFGVVSIQFSNGSYDFRRFTHLPTRVEIESAIHRILNYAQVDAAETYITRWDETTQKVVEEFGRIPPPGKNEDCELDSYLDPQFNELTGEIEI